MKSVALALMSCVVAGSASADITDFREWLDVNGVATNSTSSSWYGTRGFGGPLLTSNGSYWYSPGHPNDVPIIASLTEVGSHDGAAGPATFAGSFVHTGASTAAVIVFAPQTPVMFTAMNVHSELVVNGLTGNGVTIQVRSVIDGVQSDMGPITLSGTASDRLDTFTLPGGPQLLEPGDSVHVIIGNNGSYLYDHVNVNAWLTVPAPGSAVVLAGAGLMLRRRR